MEIHISAISEEDYAALVELIESYHADTTAALQRLENAMADVSEVLNEIAAGLRGPLATSILDLISERDAAERARVEAVNALAEEQGREATETASESEASKNARDAFGEVAGLFEKDTELPDVEPLPELPADVDPTVEDVEPNTDPEPAAPADEVAAEDAVVEPEVTEEPAPADEAVEDTSGAVVPSDDYADDYAGDEVAAEDVPDSEAGATDADSDVVPNPGAAAEEN